MASNDKFSIEECFGEDSSQLFAKNITVLVYEASDFNDRLSIKDADIARQWLRPSCLGRKLSDGERNYWKDQNAMNLHNEYLC